MSGCYATSRSVDGMKQWCLSQTNLKKKSRASAASPFATSGNVFYSY